MSQPFVIILSAEGHEDIIVSGVFERDEPKILEQYLDQYQELIQSKALKAGLPCQINVKYDEDSGLQIDTSLPADDAIAVLLHRLRPFILEREQASFLKVRKIVNRRVDNTHIQRLLDLELKRYDMRQYQGMIRITSGGRLINTPKVLDDWLNSHEYHRDPYKREEIQSLSNMMPSDLFRHTLISMLIDKVNAIRNLASIIAVILGKSQRVSFTVDEGTPKGIKPLRFQISSVK